MSRRSACVRAFGRSSPVSPPPFSVSSCIGINSGFMLILHWTILGRAPRPGCVTVQDKMASKSVNKVILIGHLGKDADTKFTPSGISISKFSLATNRSTKDQQSGEWKEITDWHNIAVWRTEHVANFLLKGKQIYLEGRLETRSYEDKEGQKKYVTEVVCDAQSLVLLGVGGGRGDAPSEGSG